MRIGENIKKFRLAHHMEQKDLGKALNVSDKTISSWECNRTEPKMGMIQRMAEIFGVENSDIINGNVYEAFDNPNDFELAWYRSGGGQHPIKLTDEEYSFILEVRTRHDPNFYKRMSAYMDLFEKRGDK